MTLNTVTLKKPRLLFQEAKSLSLCREPSSEESTCHRPSSRVVWAGPMGQAVMLSPVLGTLRDTVAVWGLANECMLSLAGEKGVRVELNKPSDSVSKDA